MGLRAAAVALVLAGLPLVAAHGQSGWYFGGGIGANFLTDSDLSGTGVNTSAEHETGPIGALAGGYRFGNGFRAELEMMHRDNSVDDLQGIAGGTGDVDAQSLMANLLYDIPVNWPVRPYLGIGLGGARVNADTIGPLAGSSLDDSDNVFAYQGIVGLSYQMTSALQAFADYRYFATQDPDLDLQTGASIDGEYASHTVLVGLRYLFGASPPRRAAQPAPTPAAAPAPPPAPKPAPAPAPKSTESTLTQPKPAPPPRNFIVFFDWDSTVLTAETLEILREAARYVAQGGIARIRLSGHADRSGPVRYNIGLSRRRAELVRDQMVRLGTAASDIALEWKGESQPLKPTPDGVREPQNRRVEIRLGDG